jgi:hypothetical protein
MKTKTVTLALDEDLCRRVRFWAAQRGTSLSAVVRTILETVPNMPLPPRKRNRSQSRHTPSTPAQKPGFSDANRRPIHLILIVKKWVFGQ